ncbi:hypothetical protein D9M72_580350 [compost metagenome]
MSSRAVLVARICSTPAASRVENSEVLTVLPWDVGSVALGLLILQPVRARQQARATRAAACRPRRLVNVGCFNVGCAGVTGAPLRRSRRRSGP